MKQPSLSQHVCIKCQTAIAEDEVICARCDAQIEGAGLPTEKSFTGTDHDATIYSPLRINTRLYRAAIRQAEEVAEAEEAKEKAAGRVQLATGEQADDGMAEETIRRSVVGVAFPPVEDDATCVQSPVRARQLALAREAEQAEQSKKAQAADTLQSTKKKPATRRTRAGDKRSRSASARGLAGFFSKLSPRRLEDHLYAHRRRYFPPVALVLLLAMIGYGASSILQHEAAPAQLQARQSRVQLDQSLQHARDTGVAWFQLENITNREQQISGQDTRFLLFQPLQATGFYLRQARDYRALTAQVPEAIRVATAQDQEQARLNLQKFESTLASVSGQGLNPSRAITQQFSQDQVQFSSAQSAADFQTINSDSTSGIQALNLFVSTSQELNNLQTMIKNMQLAHIDATASEQAYQKDQALLQQAVLPGDLETINGLIQSQYQTGLMNELRAYPYVGSMKLQALTEGVQQLHTYGVDTHSYTALLKDRQRRFSDAKTTVTRIAFFNQIDADLSRLQTNLTEQQARYLVKQFQREVSSWGNGHAYHDAYDGKTYQLDNGYMQPGIGSTLDNDLAGARTPADYAALLTEVSNDLFNLHQLEAAYQDTTPYNRVHASDLKMLDRYHLQKGQVMVVSLAEQVMRVYQDGKLIKAYYVTTGRQALPSLPGVWSVQDRRSPVIFKAAEPQGSPYWFPDTPIHYAILYHVGGYFVHDAPWRADYGPHTNFPHQDSGGTSSYNFDGSHGCINLNEQDAAWIYKNTSWNTAIVVY